MNKFLKIVGIGLGAIAGVAVVANAIIIACAIHEINTCTFCVED